MVESNGGACGLAGEGPGCSRLREWKPFVRCVDLGSIRASYFTGRCRRLNGRYRLLRPNQRSIRCEHRPHASGPGSPHSVTLGSSVHRMLKQDRALRPQVSGSWVTAFGRTHPTFVSTRTACPPDSLRSGTTPGGTPSYRCVAPRHRGSVVRSVTEQWRNQAARGEIVGKPAPPPLLSSAHAPQLACPH